MSFAESFRRTTGLVAALALLSNPTVSFPQDDWPRDDGQQQGLRHDDGQHDNDDLDKLSLKEKIELLRRKVKFVFVIYHENESFDHFFGTYPGANGLFSAPRGATPAKATPGFTQRYLDTSLRTVTVSPYLMPQAVKTAAGQIVPIYPADEISVDHSHQGMSNSLHVDPATGIAANDRYAMDQEGLTTDAQGNIVAKTGVPATAISLAQKQKAETDIGHIDCDTIPFMWHWAKNFVLFDNFRQSIVGPSTPNAIALIAGQSGQTQWARHNNEGATVTYANPAFPNPIGASYGSQVMPSTSNAFVPVVNDPGPFPGSNLDTNAVKPPFNFDENPANPTLNLTFASQPLSFMGKNVKKITATDQNPTADLADIQEDMKVVSDLDPAVNWGWYQQGFNNHDASDPYEPQNSTTPNPAHDPGLNTGYVLHHNGPQYFGYLADNPQVLNNNLHGAKDFFDAVEARKLPPEGGVFYLRGGYDNNDGLVPVNPTPAIQHAFLGNDDHPAYSDQQISEAFAAKAINDIANSPYWAESAIIITYDETDGFYDHVSPHRRSTFADGSPLAAGPRIPTILISPYAKAGKISHRYSEHGSVIKFINELYGLVPLASLPDEKRGRELGATTLGQPNLGPSDDPDNEVGDLTEAFDYDILRGEKEPIAAARATFPQNVVATLPHLATPNYAPNGYTNGACEAIGILPTDFPSLAAYKAGEPIDPYPVDVNPRPTQSPGTPTSGTWTP
ncbi:alkaline phosphatase family protein [Paraburkholderia mimosarum]|uniref:alkaline phosphatase family protein n=1 Tax=Paraburkholderia mimosarum TaxID=312026 RepID=UPI0013789C3A|nr:alkaline phosphatase family protein [Paraburkholderia mimosarum]